MKKAFKLRLAAAVITAGAVAGSCVEVLAASAAMPPIVREQVVVHDYVVTVGDLFLNAGESSDVAIATAPAPGQRDLFDSTRLSAIAREYGLDWKPTGRGDRVMVERASREVGAERLENLIAAAVAEQNAGWQFDVELDNRLQTLRLPTGSDVRITVENLRVDVSGRRVSAAVVAPDGRRGETRTQVTGKLFDVIDVPVLRYPVMPGEIIRDADIEWTKVRADRIRRGTITDRRWIVGLTPRRPVTPGTPLFSRDLEERIVIEKGAMVTILYRTPNMMLSTIGRALDAGADGAPIRVVNTQSNRTIEAVVTGPDRVEIRPASMLAFNQRSSR